MPDTNRALQPGTLLANVHATTVHALQSGNIHPIPTRFEFVEQGGVNFLVRIVSNLVRKDQAKVDQLAAGPKKDRSSSNPFLPYDQDLYVTDLSHTHVCLLNKFNVLDHHILMITRSFQDQESLLTVADFEAVLMCLAEIDGLAFYNSGEAAGASQRHRHWQMVPLPLETGLPHIPIEPLLHTARYEGAMGFVPGLHFKHVLTRLNTDWLAFPRLEAHALWRHYVKLLELAGVTGSKCGKENLQPDPYNLFVTRDWILLVPRVIECVDGISINALGFAGGLLVKDEQQLRLLKTIGPMTALQRVARPLPSY